MRLVSSRIHPQRSVRAGILYGDWVLDLALLLRWAWEHRRADLPADLVHATAFPTTMQEALDQGVPFLAGLEALVGLLVAEMPERLEVEGRPVAAPLEQVRLCAPLPRPPSVRDFYAFEQHVKAARAQRGLGMIPEWYEFPVFYFSNAAAIYGPEDVIPYPSQSQALDYELEIACILGRGGVNIPVEEAERYIAGYTVMNDWSARDIQRKEMAVGLGPAKGKDFATSLGPWLVTPGELQGRALGNGRYDLTMVARVNGREYSRGNFKDITFTFPEMIARASQDCPLVPGDVLGSGTVGTGCILELGPENAGGWLRPGDVVELEIQGLGVLRNTVSAPRGTRTED